MTILSSMDLQAWLFRDFRLVTLSEVLAFPDTTKVVLWAIMLCRSKDLWQDGLPVLSLPPKTVSIVECQFDGTERAFYEALAQKLASRVNDLQLMHMGKHWAFLMVMLLRLRQGGLSSAVTCQVPLKIAL